MVRGWGAWLHIWLPWAHVCTRVLGPWRSPAPPGPGSLAGAALCLRGAPLGPPAPPLPPRAPRAGSTRGAGTHFIFSARCSVSSRMAWDSRDTGFSIRLSKITCEGRHQQRAQGSPPSLPPPPGPEGPCARSRGRGAGACLLAVPRPRLVGQGVFPPVVHVLVQVLGPRGAGRHLLEVEAGLGDARHQLCVGGAGGSARWGASGRRWGQRHLPTRTADGQSGPQARLLGVPGRPDPDRGRSQTLNSGGRGGLQGKRGLGRGPGSPPRGRRWWRRARC